MQKSPNSSLLSGGLEDMPTVIFAHVGTQTTEQHMLDMMLHRLRTDGDLSPLMIEELAYRPHMISDLLIGDMIPEHQLRRVMTRNPAAGCRAMLKDYQLLAPKVERFLLNDLESVERIVQFTRNRPDIELLQPLDFYINLAGRDPNRLLRLWDTDRSMDENDLVRKLDEIYPEAVARRNEDPGWALFYLRTNRVKHVEEGVAAALRKSDEHAYFAAKHCREMDMPSTVWHQIVRDVVDPRWVYHLLRDGLTVEPDKKQPLLYQSPPWLVQYMASCRLSQQEKGQLFLECQMINSTAETVPFLGLLELWFQWQGASHRSHQINGAINRRLAEERKAS